MSVIRFCPNCGSCHSMPRKAPKFQFPVCSRQVVRCRQCDRQGHLAVYCYVVRQILNMTLSAKEEQRLMRVGMYERQRRIRDFDSYKPRYRNDRLRRPIDFVKQLELPLFSVQPDDDIAVTSRDDFEKARARRLKINPRPTVKEPTALRIMLRLAIGSIPFKRAITVVQGSSLPCASKDFMTKLPAEVKIEDPLCWLDVRGERAFNPVPGETFHFAKQVKVHELPTLSIAVVEVNGRVDCVVGTAWNPVNDVSIDWLTLEHDLISNKENEQYPPPPYSSNADKPIVVFDNDEDTDLIML